MGVTWTCLPAVYNRTNVVYCVPLMIFDEPHDMAGRKLDESGLRNYFAVWKLLKTDTRGGGYAAGDCVAIGDGGKMQGA